jgi:hypothetical protein
VAPINTIQGPDTGLSYPTGIALDSAGDIFVANATETSGSVTEYAPIAAGDAPPTVTIPSSKFGGNTPGDVAVNAAGDLFVSDGINESVYEFAPPFTATSVPIATLTGSSTDLDNPDGLSFDPSGDLFVSNNDSITEYAASNGFNGDVAPVVNFTTSRPGATGFDSAGNLYLPADTDSGVYVEEFAPPLTSSSQPAVSITGSNTDLDVPTGVAIAQVGPPAKLAFVTQPSGGSAGKPFGTQPAVTVEDANGNVVPTDTSQVTLSITPGTGASGAALTCHANPVAASTGVATFSGCTINKAGTGYELHAADGTLTPAVSGAFAITPGPADDHFTWSTQPIAAPANLKPSEKVKLTVTALNAGGGPVRTGLVYLSLATPLPSAEPRGDADNAFAVCGPKNTNLPAYCPVNDLGRVQVTYTASSRQYELGSDVLTAAVDPFGTDAAADQYTYAAAPGTPVTSYSWRPDPVAPSWHLAQGKGGQGHAHGPGRGTQPGGRGQRQHRLRA